MRTNRVGESWIISGWTRRLGVLMVGMALTAPSAFVAVSAETAESCAVRDDSDLRTGAPRDIDGYLPHEAWLAADGPQVAIRRINDHLESRFGQPDKEDPDGSLRRGLIGMTADHHTQQVVVVVDPGMPGRKGILNSLQAISLAASREPGVPLLDVKVLGGCASSADLVASSELLRSRRWHPRAASITYAFHVDPDDSRVHVELGTTDADVVEALRRQLGDRVAVTMTDVSRQSGSRADDVSPHYGGAGISMSKGPCTAGFTVILPDGKRGSVTADHCVLNGELFSNGDADDYGQAQEVAGYPTYDMARIRPTAGQTYTNRIWTDPCCPSTRSVTSWEEPKVLDYVCVSGYITRAKCGIKVTTNDDSICDAGGCTTGLMRGEKIGYNISAQGDSGAPVYVRVGDTQAKIKGMNVAGGPGVIQAERITAIKNHLGVTPLMTP